ncbi:hypothetical protein BJY01DRAFT_246146 [Aspergillus pseudoustus]|uniref:Fungal-specific transcription factor domain-containing protein n=1 Tax=Aspergillus pseudoustus TaxID=1810923 RepID=A0ABR4K9S6_9EURO
MREAVDNLTYIDYAIATTLLLTWWSACENGGAHTWKLHLTATRDLVSRKLGGLLRCHNSSSTIAATTSATGLGRTGQVLLEWFYYSDSITAITATERTCFLDVNRHAAHTLPVGAASAYRWAIFVMLFFTVDRYCTVDDFRVQHALHTLAHYVRSLPTAEGALATPLFPLFIYGVTVLGLGEQRLVADKIAAYARYTGRGCVEDALAFLQDWWLEQYAREDDASTNSWWGWEEFLKVRDIHLVLV